MSGSKRQKLPHCDVLVERLREIESMTSIVLNVNTAQTNVILGTEVHVLWGKETIRDYIGDVQFEISPLSFYQVNPLQTQVLYQTALDFAELEGNETVLDLYCGIGTISLFFAQKAKHVFGVEIVPEAIADAKRNAALNGMNNADFAVGAAEDVIPRLYEEKGITADVVVVDPPRKGCDSVLLDTIAAISPKKVVYVSCDSATLARNLGISLSERLYHRKSTGGGYVPSYGACGNSGFAFQKKHSTLKTVEAINDALRRLK